MLRLTFNYMREAGQNPFSGITSFQHFRGERLYSDCVVKAGGDMTETENFECYPVTDGVPENGRAEGWYPDTSVAYIRILWKDFEPERGKYNYDFIQSIIENAKRHKQSLMLRLMPHSTCARDDVPDWLKKMLPCPERPDGKRVKDSPTDKRFLEYFGQANEKIGEKFDDDPALYAIDVCLPGAWGEGYNLHLYSDEQINTLVDRYADAFKKTHLLVQIAKPRLLTYLLGKGVPAGWRGDGIGHPAHMNTYYPEWYAELPKDVWKTAPVSFEAYWWLGEWLRKGWDIDAVIEKTLEWHISSFNPKSMPIPYVWKEKIEYWLSKMGYHYVIDCVTLPKKIVPNKKLEIRFDMDNVGVAPIYNKIPLKVRLKGEKAEEVFITNTDITKWLPGKTCEKISFTVPKGLPGGEYKVQIGIFDELSRVYFATDAVQDGNYYTLANVIVI